MSQNSKIIIKNRQCAFPNLAEAKSFVEGTEGKFNIKMLIPKDDKEFVKNFKEWVKTQIDATDWTQKIKGQIFKSSFIYKSDAGYNDNCVLKDGDEMNENRIDNGKDPYDFYAGHYIISANRKGSWGPPLVVGTNAEAIALPNIKEVIVGGYWVNIQVGSYCYSNVKTGVSIQLIAVQKIKEDTAFGQQNPFEVLEGAEEESTTEETEGNPFD